ncbi:MAG: class I SAM-dependent methyltransferase [bacterium]|nr:class I SAM-dependent methyltransferase [bacterium]
MITRIQGKTLAGEIAVRREPRLTALEKSMLRWVVVDPEDRLLDANVGSGMMAEYLRRNMQCEVCGVSDRMDQVRGARERLRNCDIVYAPAGDIPWREDAFDTVLMKMDAEEPELAERMIAEARRVLKPGGQLILGVMSMPRALSALTGLLVSEEKRRLTHRHVQAMLANASYEKITWQRTGVTMGVMIGWKSKPGLDELHS